VQLAHVSLLDGRIGLKEARSGARGLRGPMAIGPIGAMNRPSPNQYAEARKSTMIYIIDFIDINSHDGMN
jgi:hypothetical protein